jgi:hypothetical protein
VFGRRKHEVIEPVEPEEFVDDLDAEDRAAEDAQLQSELEVQEARESRENPPNRPQGPWDSADAPAGGSDGRIDLGALLVPVPEDTEVRVDVGPEGEVVAATLVQGESSLQLNAFAAPRSAGIWQEVRDEIAEALRSTGGSAEDADGPLGVELRATVPTEAPGQEVVQAPARFLGVDGPRWFLRGLITGPAALDAAAGASLEAALRDVVVVRGGDPMAVRDPLPLVLPKQAQPDPENEAAGFQMPERGPEITETR